MGTRHSSYRSCDQRRKIIVHGYRPLSVHLTQESGKYTNHLSGRRLSIQKLCLDQNPIEIHAAPVARVNRAPAQRRLPKVLENSPPIGVVIDDGIGNTNPPLLSYEQPQKIIPRS